MVAIKIERVCCVHRRVNRQMIPALRKCISSNIQDLNRLHAEHWWIPDETMIRPNPKVLEGKHVFSQYVLTCWKSYRDFILDTHFKYAVATNDKEQLYVVDDIRCEDAEWLLMESLYPYAVSAGVHHSVLWNSYYDYFEDFSEVVINDKITGVLRGQLGHDNFDFCWYVNPKPSIPELWHCQVFWISDDSH